MTRTARKSLAAAIALAALSGGWASAATLADSHEGTGAGASKGVRAAQSERTRTAPAPTTLALDHVPATTAPPTTVRPAAPPVPTTIPVAQQAKAPPNPITQHPGPRADGLSDCATPADGTYELSTESEFRTAMTHVWLLCQAPSFFGTNEAGLEIRADGRWSKLERKPNGSLVRASGWGQEGSWGTFDTSAMNGPGTYEASFEIDGRGASYAMPIFGSGGLRVRLDGVSAADYVTAPSGTVVVPGPAGSGRGCDGTESTYSPSTESEFRAAVTGAWLLCGTPSFFGTDEAGLEIRTDGRWSKLQKGPERSLVRLSGPGNEGVWDVVDVSAMNGRRLFEIAFNIDGSGTASDIPAFARQGSQVSKMRLENTGVFVADYVPASPGTPIA